MRWKGEFEVMTIKKKVIKHKIIGFAKEVAFGILAGAVFGIGFCGVILLYCLMAGPLVIVFK